MPKKRFQAEYLEDDPMTIETRLSGMDALVAWWPWVPTPSTEGLAACMSSNTFRANPHPEAQDFEGGIQRAFHAA